MEIVVRRIDVHSVAICTIVVRLNHKSNLHIKTTARHALDVLGGHTLFSPKDTTVFDLNGKKLPLRELKRLDAGSAKP